MKKIGFIGTGNMAKAIIQSMIKNGFDPCNIPVFDIDEKKYKLINENLDFQNDISCVVSKSDIIFLAVKPQNYKEVLSSIKHCVSSDKTFVSIAAGITTNYIVNALDNIPKAIRVMPNTPLLLNKGAVAIAQNLDVSNEIFDIVKQIFELSSLVEIISEDKMDEIISVNGSSPAYVYLFVKAIVDYAQSVGLDYDVCLNLICQTLIGSAEMIKHSGYDLDDLIKMVSSPGGTTLAALDTLNQLDFYGSIKQAMQSCTNRAKELSKGLQ